jgi:hypothetical protein
LFPVTITFVCLGRIATSSEEAELGDDSTHRGAFTSGTPTFNADLSLNTILAIKKGRWKRVTGGKRRSKCVR